MVPVRPCCSTPAQYPAHCAHPTPGTEINYLHRPGIHTPRAPQSHASGLPLSQRHTRSLADDLRLPVRHAGHHVP